MCFAQQHLSSFIHRWYFYDTHRVEAIKANFSECSLWACRRRRRKRKTKKENLFRHVAVKRKYKSLRQKLHCCCSRQQQQEKLDHINFAASKLKFIWNLCTNKTSLSVWPTHEWMDHHDAPSLSYTFLLFKWEDSESRTNFIVRPKSSQTSFFCFYGFFGILTTTTTTMMRWCWWCWWWWRWEWSVNAMPNLCLLN